MNRKRGTFSKLLLLFTVVPFIELFLLLKLAEYTGAFATFSLIIITGIVGASLAKQQGRQVLMNMQTEMSYGNMPGEQILDGLCVLVGGALLLTPGILTDIFGFSLIIPISRMFYKGILKEKIKKKLEEGTMKVYIHK